MRPGMEFALNFVKSNAGIDSPALLSSSFLLVALWYISPAAEACARLRERPPPCRVTSSSISPPRGRSSALGAWRVSRTPGSVSLSCSRRPVESSRRAFPPAHTPARPSPSCTGGRAPTPPHAAAGSAPGGAGGSLSALAARPTLRVLCAFTCRQETTTGESTAGNGSMFSPLVGGRSLL
jgi:hypothetical protein